MFVGPALSNVDATVAISLDEGTSVSKMMLPLQNCGLPRHATAATAAFYFQMFILLMTR